MAKKKDAALEAVFTEGYSFEAAGRTYTVRRLNIKDVFTLARLLQIGLRALPKEFAFEQINESTLAQMFLAAMQVGEPVVIEWAASLVGMAPKEFEHQPPEVLLGIIEVLRDHVDVKAFFDRAVKLVEKMETKKS